MTRLISIAFCLLLIVAGCGGSADEEAVEKKIEAATGGEAEVDLSEDAMEIEGKTEEGEYAMSVGEKTEIPKDFPGDVFIYKPSTPAMSMKVPEGHSLTLITSDDRAKVTETYKEKMEADGWSEEGSMNMGGQMMLVYKKDGRVANIGIASVDDKTQITLTVAAE